MEEKEGVSKRKGGSGARRSCCREAESGEKPGRVLRESIGGSVIG